MRRLARRIGTRASLGAILGGTALATIALGVVVAFGADRDRAAALTDAPSGAVDARVELASMPNPPRSAAGDSVARAAETELVLAPIVIRGAAKGWSHARSRPLAAGEPVPVVITSYCLSGTTRRGRYVRAGIIAADPRYFPLSRYVELYAGTRYLGRFLVDDTGSNIRGPRIDVWLPTCRESRIFGRRRGTAVLVPTPDQDAGSSGRE